MQKYRIQINIFLIDGEYTAEAEIDGNTVAVTEAHKSFTASILSVGTLVSHHKEINILDHCLNITLFN